MNTYISYFILDTFYIISAYILFSHDSFRFRRILSAFESAIIIMPKRKNNVTDEVGEAKKLLVFPHLYVWQVNRFLCFFVWINVWKESELHFIEHHSKANIHFFQLLGIFLSFICGFHELGKPLAFLLFHWWVNSWRVYRNLHVN